MNQMGKRPVRLPGRDVAANEKPPTALRRPEDLTFVLGEVTQVNTQRMTVTVNLRDSRGIIEGVLITQPFAGNSSYIMGMPEKGSLVLLGATENRYIVLTYFPHYSMGLEGRNIKKWSDDIKTSEQNEYFFRVKKLEKGDVALGSSKGMELMLSENISLGDRIGNRLDFNSSLDSFIHTSLGNYVFSSGVYRSAGIIRRNSLDIFDREDYPNVFKDESKKGYVLRPGSSDDSMRPYFTEYLLEVDEQGYAFPPSNDINSYTEQSRRKPVAVFSLGNYVGNNPVLESYGRILRPTLFTDPDDDFGTFSLDPVTGDLVQRYGMAITLFKPDRTDPTRGAFFGVDKEGHFYQFIPSTTGGGLGKGRSMSIVARGSKKEAWGADSRYANSWDLRTSGGIIWNIGSHNERDQNPHTNRSIDVRTSSSAYYRYGSEQSDDLQDFDDPDQTLESTRDYFKIEKVGGKERKEVESTRETLIQGNDKLRIDGARTEEVDGAVTVLGGSNYNLIVGDAFTEKVTKEKQELFGSRKTTITSGGSELKIQSLVGNITEEITKVGSKTVRVRVGDIEDSITAGNRKTTVTAGNIESETLSGDLKMKSGLGQLFLQTQLGRAQLRASQNIDVSTLPVSNVNISGGTINLKGRTGISGGVVTSRTHLDYITGAPLRGSTSVKATF